MYCLPSLSLSKRSNGRAGAFYWPTLQSGGLAPPLSGVATSSDLVLNETAADSDAVWLRGARTCSEECAAEGLACDEVSQSSSMHRDAGSLVAFCRRAFCSRPGGAGGCLVGRGPQRGRELQQGLPEAAPGHLRSECARRDQLRGQPLLLPGRINLHTCSNFRHPTMRRATCRRLCAPLQVRRPSHGRSTPRGCRHCSRSS